MSATAAVYVLASDRASSSRRMLATRRNRRPPCTSGWDGCTEAVREARDGRRGKNGCHPERSEGSAVRPSTSPVPQLLCVVRLVVGCFAAGFLVGLFLDREDFADELELEDLGFDLALLDLDLLDLALLDLLPIRPALTVVCTRPRRTRATRSGRFQPMARSARNFAGISSMPSP